MIRTFFTGTGKMVSYDRIGPHNIDIISIIVGSVLGDSHLEKRSRGVGTRIIFEQSNRNVEYLMWFHSYFSCRGYCNPEKPKALTQKNKTKRLAQLAQRNFFSLSYKHIYFF